MKQLFKALDMIRRCHPSSFYWRIFYVVVLNVLPLLSLYILKYMVDAVTTGEMPELLGIKWSTLSLLGLFCLLFLLNRLVIIHAVSHISIGELEFNVKYRVVGFTGGDINFIVEINRRSRFVFPVILEPPSIVALTQNAMAADFERDNVSVALVLKIEGLSILVRHGGKIFFGNGTQVNNLWLFARTTCQADDRDEGHK